MQYANLLEYKEKNGLSVLDLAKEFGVTSAHISMILAGKRFPSRRLAQKISQKTGIPVLRLLYPQEEARV
ncbi:MAG: helix-turn-helix transcriptional regulator [Clostridiales bacterium]|nr:helix-turn-helix transcriptional regulator [Clostridiales bacterium]